MVQVCCVYFKNKLNTSNLVYKTSKNNKHMIHGKCVKCTKRSQFISEAGAKKGFIFSVPAIACWCYIVAISSLATGASAIGNSANKKKSEDKKKNQEMKRHNKAFKKKAFQKSRERGYI